MRCVLVPTDLSAAGWLVTGEAASWGERKFSAWLPYLANVRCRTFVVVGDTADAIIEVTQVEGVDLIIMRAPKRRWWCAILAGSVTDTVMHRAPVPVVVSAGLGQMSASGCWKATRHPHEQDIPQEGAWREEYSLVTMAAPIQTPQ